MAEDILEGIDDDSGDNIMDENLEDILEDSPKDSLDKTKTEEQKKSRKKWLAKPKKIFKQIFGSKKSIIILTASFILIIALAMGVWMFFFKAAPEDIQNTGESTAVQKDINNAASREDEMIFEDIIDLEPFERIQLRSGSGMGLVSMTLSLELIDQKDRKQVVSVEERLRKIITEQAGEMAWLELKNPEGKIRLKYNLLKRMNSIFPKALIRNIYFTTFIMQ